MAIYAIRFILVPPWIASPEQLPVVRAAFILSPPWRTSLEQSPIVHAAVKGLFYS